MVMINQSGAKGPQQWDDKVAAFQKLRNADNAYLANDSASGDVYLKAGQLLVDIATAHHRSEKALVRVV